MSDTVSYDLVDVDEIRTDTELEAYAPPHIPLTEDTLRDAIRSEGRITDPVVLWAEANLLVEGHTRVRLVKELVKTLRDPEKVRTMRMIPVRRKSFGQPFSARGVPLKRSWDKVYAEIDEQSLLRRQMNPGVLRYVTGRLYNLRKGGQGGNRTMGPCEMDAATSVAEMARLSRASIFRYAKCAEYLDVIRGRLGPRERKTFYRVVEAGLNPAQLEDLAAVEDPEDLKEDFAELVSGRKRKRQEGRRRRVTQRPDGPVDPEAGGGEGEDAGAEAGASAAQPRAESPGMPFSNLPPEQMQFVVYPHLPVPNLRTPTPVSSGAAPGDGGMDPADEPDTQSQPAAHQTPPDEDLVRAYSTTINLIMSWLEYFVEDTGTHLHIASLGKAVLRVQGVRVDDATGKRFCGEMLEKMNALYRAARDVIEFEKEWFTGAEDPD